MPDTSVKPIADPLFKRAINAQWTPQRFAHEFAFGSLDAENAKDAFTIRRKAAMLASLSTALRSSAVKILTAKDFEAARVKIAEQGPAPIATNDTQSYYNEHFRVKAQIFMDDLLASDETLAMSLAKAALETTNWASVNERIPTVRLFDGLAEAFASPELQEKIARKAAKAVKQIEQKMTQQKISKGALDSQLDAWIEKHLNSNGDLPDNLFTKGCYLANWAKKLSTKASALKLSHPDLPDHAPEGVRMAIAELSAMVLPNLQVMGNSDREALTALSDRITASPFVQKNSHAIRAIIEDRSSYRSPR